MAQRGYYEEYSIDELNDLRPDQNFKRAFASDDIIEETITNDDRFLSKTWTHAYKYAAYYYDNPSIEDRNFHLNKFRLHFGNLLSKTSDSNEMPDLRSRSDFVRWVCKKHNEFVAKEEGNFKVDCNVDKLIQTYGPNYENVKKAIGAIDYRY